MKRLHRRWHRLIWCLLLPVLAAVLLLGVSLRPRALLNPSLPPALENTAVETPSPGSAPNGRAR